MQKDELRIVSVNPGSRYLGIAVFCGTELREWAVKVISPDSPEEKMVRAKEIISNYVDLYGANVLALKRLHPSRGSPALRQLVSSLRNYGKARRLEQPDYSIKEVKRSLLPRGGGNKHHLVEQVLARYPFLHDEAERERKSKNLYLIRMFEAIAMGIVCFNEFDIRKQKVAKANK